MKSTALPLSVPFKADLVASPIVAYGAGPCRIEFLSMMKNLGGRVTFESAGKTVQLVSAQAGRRFEDVPVLVKALEV